MSDQPKFTVHGEIPESATRMLLEMFLDLIESGEFLEDDEGEILTTHVPKEDSDD